MTAWGFVALVSVLGATCVGEPPQSGGDVFAVVGRVLDADGNPLAGARVLADNGGSYQVMLQQFSAGPRESLCIFSGAKVTVGAWTHIAAVIQGNEGRVYVNGRREGAGKRAEAPETSSDPLTFGYGGLHQSMTGLIDDIRLYSRALTDQEIQKLAAAK